MEQDTAVLDNPVLDIGALDETDAAVEEELLIEEISIDGMCGVY